MTTVLFYPIADRCPNECLYCFENTEKRVFKGYDKSAMADTAEKLMENEKRSKSNNEFAFDASLILHGGEILELPLNDLEFFLQETVKYKKFGHVQTSLGLPISDEQLRIFRKYNTTFGISVDGPKEFNILRGPRNPDRNKEFQDVVFSNIQRLKEENIRFGVLTILSKANASYDKIDSLIEWCVNTTQGGRFNPLFIPHHSDGSEIAEYALTPRELANAFMKLTDAALKHPQFNFALLNEIKGALIGDFKVVCAFTRCDYLTTRCNAILPDGHIARCDRTFQDGYYYISPKASDARWQMLEQTECKGCKYFVACGGGCPAEGIGGDFRSKTSYCEAYFAMFRRVETMLRKMFPGIILTIDVHNYHEDYVKTGKRFNYLLRHDEKFADTMKNFGQGVKMLGWTPDKEKERQQKQGSSKKSGVGHMDSPSRKGDGGCGCNK